MVKQAELWTVLWELSYLPAFETGETADLEHEASFIGGVKVRVGA